MTDAEIAHALGRYRQWYVIGMYWLGFLLYAIAALTRLVHGTAETITSLGAALIWLCLAILSLHTAATVVTLSGFLRGFRFYRWEQVAAVLPPGPGHPQTQVLLTDDKKIPLPGLPENRLPGIYALVAHAGTSLPDGPDR